MLKQIDILNKCKHKYEYYSPFIDKCIAILQFKQEGRIQGPELEAKVKELNSFTDLLYDFWDEDKQTFAGGILEVILAYKRKLRLV